MPRARKQVPESRGLLQLEKLLERRNQKDLAAETDIPQSVISDIVNRWRLPSLTQALALKKLGIAPTAWTEPASAKGAA